MILILAHCWPVSVVFDHPPHHHHPFPKASPATPCLSSFVRRFSSAYMLSMFTQRRQFPTAGKDRADVEIPNVSDYKLIHCLASGVCQMLSACSHTSLSSSSTQEFSFSNRFAQDLSSVGVWSDSEGCCCRFPSESRFAIHGRCCCILTFRRRN